MVRPLLVNRLPQLLAPKVISKYHDNTSKKSRYQCSHEGAKSQRSPEKETLQFQLLRTLLVVLVLSYFPPLRAGLGHLHDEDLVREEEDAERRAARLLLRLILRRLMTVQRNYCIISEGKMSGRLSFVLGYLYSQHITSSSALKAQRVTFSKGLWSENHRRLEGDVSFFFHKNLTSQNCFREGRHGWEQE